MSPPYTAYLRRDTQKYIDPKTVPSQPFQSKKTTYMADQRRARGADHRVRLSRSRSRSPQRHDSHTLRIRSPRRHHHKKHSPETVIKDLPYNSRALTKRDYGTFKPLFQSYLDIQKGKILDDLDEIEVKGRWKSFIGKW
jgi:hypothetical protein